MKEMCEFSWKVRLSCHLSDDLDVFQVLGSTFRGVPVKLPGISLILAFSISFIIAVSLQYFSRFYSSGLMFSFFLFVFLSVFVSLVFKK